MAASTRADRPAGAQPDADRFGTFTGEIEGTDVAVAVVTDGKRVRAYVCDGAGISAWFEGRLVGNSFRMSADDGSTITGALTDGGATGTLTSTDGPVAGSFSAVRPTGGGGVFRSEFATSDDSQVSIRWIVFDDGTQRGNAETKTVDGKATAPAPPLDVEVARTQATVPVAPAGGPAPVAELTPTTIVNPAPTTQTAGAPPPIPSPAPTTLEPLQVTATVTPPKADVGAPERYQLTLTNPNKTALKDAGVRVGLPPGLAVQPATDKTTCKGTFVAFPPGTTKPGDPTLIVSGATLEPGASCTAAVDLVAAAPIAVDVVTDAPTAGGAPPGKPVRVTFLIGPNAVGPATATTKPPTTTTTKPPVTTTTTTKAFGTTTSKAATTTTKSAGTTTTTIRPPVTTTTVTTNPAAVKPGAPRDIEPKALKLRDEDGRENGRVEVSFRPPEDDGGATVTTFAARCRSPERVPLPGFPLSLEAEAVGGASPVIVTGLRVDREYTCSVAAINRIGEGPEGSATAPIEVVGIPGVPRDIKLDPQRLGDGDGPENGRVEVSFLPPENEGGAPITGFAARCTSPEQFPRAGVPSSLIAVEFGSASPLMVSGFRVDREYRCTVNATNRIGEGPERFADAPVTVGGVPGAPRDIEVKSLKLRDEDDREHGRAEVTFLPPENEGGTPVTGFAARCRSPEQFPRAGVPSSLVAVEFGSASPLTVTGLRVDREYTCTVNATNRLGEGSERFADAPVEVDGVPGAPRDIEVKPLKLRDEDGPENGRAEVTFLPPENEGGAPVTDFAARCTSPTTTATGVPSSLVGVESGSASPLTVTGLRVGAEYTCTVNATNRLGEGPERFATTPVKVVGVPPTPTTTTTAPPAGSPSAPRDVTAKPLPLGPTDGGSDGRVEVSFLVPEKEGGSPVTSYAAECRFSGAVPGPSASGSASPLTLTGFVVLVAYECTVTARNLAGPGPAGTAAEKVRVTFPVAPSAPRDVTAKPLDIRAGDSRTDGRVEVSFREPERDGGLPVKSYLATCRRDPGDTSAPFALGSASPLTLKGLFTGVAYTCEVTATNRVSIDQGGTSPPGIAEKTVTVTFPGAPTAPRNVTARPLAIRAGETQTDGRVEVTFDEPERDGGLPITGYTATCGLEDPLDPAGPFATGPALPRTFTLTGFITGAEYTCSVTANNRTRENIDQGGQSPPGIAEKTVRVIFPGAPSVPRDVKAKVQGAGDGQSAARVEVSFLEPERDGGLPITNFSASCGIGDSLDPLGPHASGTESPLALTGFEPGAEYVCSVTANNRSRADIGQGGTSPPGVAAQPVTVPGEPALVAGTSRGSSPLPVAFTLLHPPGKIRSWEINFGDGTPRVSGQGAVPVSLPHTYVNKTDQVTTLTAALSLTPEDAKEMVLTAPVQVHPTGTVISLDGTPNPKTLRRGTEGTIGLEVGNPNVTPVAGPLTVSAPAALKVTWVGAGWTCTESTCTLPSGLDAFASAPPLAARLTAPVTAPATFEVPFEIATGAGSRAQETVRIPVIGVFADAGPDQTVDATIPDPDGSLVPTRVLLDAGASLGLDGKNQTFSWRRISGPDVKLEPGVDPTGRIVAFDAPSVASQASLEFELTVAEGATKSTDRVLVTVLSRNVPPVLEQIVVSGLDTETRKEGREVVPQGRGTLALAPDASDPDGDKLTTSWRVLTQGVPNGNVTGEKFSLEWPVPGVPQVIVEATVTDPRGLRDTATVAIGVPPETLGLDVSAPARVTAGESVTARATPSRTSGVQVEWRAVSGTAPGGFPKSGRDITFTAPNVETAEIVRLEVTATEAASGATATRQVAFEVEPGQRLALSVPPAVSVDPGDPASITATVDGPEGRALQWTQRFGPSVDLENADGARVSFEAPSSAATIGLRLTATAGTETVSANTTVTVGPPPPVPTSGCGDGSAYSRFIDGNGPVVLGGVAVLSGFTVDGSGADCEEVTLEEVDVNAMNGLVVGNNLTATLDESTVTLTGGDVHLPAAFDLPDIDLGDAPLEIAFGTEDAGGGGQGTCITWDVAFSSGEFPFVPLPPGFASAGVALRATCTNVSLTANATAGAATFAINADLTAAGGANATATLTNVAALGGTASGTGSITMEPGSTATFDLTATIANPQLPVPGLTVDTARLRLRPSGITVAVEGSLGQGGGTLAVSMQGALAPTGLSLAVEADTSSPWEVGPGLSVQTANLVGTVDVSGTGAPTVDLRLAVGADWRPVPGLRVRNVSLHVANTAVPPECAIPAGGVWVRATGQGAVEIPGVSPIALAVEACMGLPNGGGTPAFSLRSTVGGPQWQVAPGVVISDVGIEVSFVGPTLTLQASGGATLLGLDLTARVVFLVPTAGGAPTVVVDASGSLSGLGIPMPSGHVVFASAAVPDFEIEPGQAIDLPQGITAVGSIDLGQPIADLLNEIFSPPTPILARITVTVSFGATIEIKAAINLGGDGATLFMGCPGGGTSCVATAPTTTRLALTSAFIRLVIGGSGGFSIGFGGEGTLNLPPAEPGGLPSPLELHMEASIQPPARVGLALFFEGQWQNAMGVPDLTLSNLGIQGSIDFSTTPIPTVTMGITGQVDHVPDGLADVLGLTNNGEPLRFTVNVDPFAPILELTLGVDDGEIVMRPLAAVGQANALEVDFASVVIAPLGGTVGAVTYDQGISAGFGANIVGVPVHVNATVDIASAHLNGTVEVGTLTIAGVRFEDTTVLVDITPQSFRQTVCGGVHVGATTLQGLFHVQAGSGGGGPATCGGVSLAAGGASTGLRARLRVRAAALPVGPVNVQELVVDAQANLGALSASFNATLNATAKLNVLANNLDVAGTIAFGNGVVQELHVKAVGNVTVGGVELSGDGTCPFATATTTTPSKGGSASGAITGVATTSGACVRLDHAPGTTTPFRFGLKGKLKAAGSTASVTGTLDQSRATLSGQLTVPTLGALDIAGTLVFGTGTQIANATGTNVNAGPGDWRVSGRFGAAKNLAGGVSARWDFVAGRVSGELFVRGSSAVAIAGATVSLAGTFSATAPGALTYSLTGSSSAEIEAASVSLATTGGGTVNLLHSAIRAGVFSFPGLAPIGGRNSDERVPERMMGRLRFSASYGVDVTLSQSGLDIDEANVSAKVVYSERFNRGAAPTPPAFDEEPSGQRNTLVNFNVDASGIDEFFEMAVADAATRTQPPAFCFTLFTNEFGSAC